MTEKDPNEIIKQLRKYLKKAVDARDEVYKELKKIQNDNEEKNMKIQMLEQLVNDSMSEKEKIAQELNEQTKKVEELEGKNKPIHDTHQEIVVFLKKNKFIPQKGKIITKNK